MKTVFVVCLVVLVILGPIVKFNQWKKIWGPKEERDAWFAEKGRTNLYRIFMLIIGLGILWFPFSILILGHNYGTPTDNSTGALVGGIFGTFFLLMSLFYKQLLSLSKNFVYDRNAKIDPIEAKTADSNSIIK